MVSTDPPLTARSKRPSWRSSGRAAGPQPRRRDGGLGRDRLGAEVEGEEGAANAHPVGPVGALNEERKDILGGSSVPEAELATLSSLLLAPLGPWLIPSRSATPLGKRCPVAPSSAKMVSVPALRAARSQAAPHAPPGESAFEDTPS
jgi:hypothetical protein